ncbi:hypothetical protein ABID08_005958 [Rhizobium binae]|uniref:Uncharacterized protein n=1 Tax=Rhizobium binae TaxID=1138190 RepID=A0ABV2MQ91_9HYPH|nr:hypothetical protein [Rhizobium binae]MBX4970020.1 hypothetical protein [Rhizobium binae]MBX4994903.1 hypothetical protein [Rhizobium binae]NKL51673.1 hypothetical protein [Rhizobium leguminosarum bv. viciae]QSY84992.1 hypothetical protein J2J99_25760 [Rhizobium binae]
MSETQPGGWRDHRPSKRAWAWSMIGSSALTMFIGFTWGGWLPVGRASVMADIAARNARAALVAEICVHNFVSSANAIENLNALKSASYWERDRFIEKGGWITIAGVKKPGADAVDRCVDTLATMKEIPAQGGTFAKNERPGMSE